MQFLSENRLNGCQILNGSVFQKPDPNQISVFRTSLVGTGHWDMVDGEM